MQTKMLLFAVAFGLSSAVCVPSEGEKSGGTKRKAEEQIRSSFHGKQAHKVDSIVVGSYTPLHVLAVSLVEKGVVEIRREVRKYAKAGVSFGARVVPPKDKFSIVASEDIGLTAKEIVMRDWSVANQKDRRRYRAFCDEHDVVIAAEALTKPIPVGISNQKEAESSDSSSFDDSSYDESSDCDEEVMTLQEQCYYLQKQHDELLRVQSDCIRGFNLVLRQQQTVSERSFSSESNAVS